MWTEEGVTFDGQYYQTVNATIYDRPEQPTPIYVAAGGPMMAKYAGRVGDGMICTSGKGMELYTDKLIPAATEGAEISGRTLDQIDRMIEIKVSYDRDPDTALANTRFWAPLSLSPEQKHSVDSAVEMERLADELPIEQVAKRWIVASDPDRGRVSADQAIPGRRVEPPCRARPRRRPAKIPRPVQHRRAAEAARPGRLSPIPALGPGPAPVRPATYVNTSPVNTSQPRLRRR